METMNHQQTLTGTHDEDALRFSQETHNRLLPIFPKRESAAHLNSRFSECWIRSGLRSMRYSKKSVWHRILFTDTRSKTLNSWNWSGAFPFIWNMPMAFWVWSLFSAIFRIQTLPSCVSDASEKSEPGHLSPLRRWDCLKFECCAAVFNEEMSLYGFTSDAEAAQQASL